jgi:hypothetical protein
MQLRRIAAPLAVVTFAAGCSGAAEASPTATVIESTASPTPEASATLQVTSSPNSVGLPDGWSRVQGDGFSIGLPDTWESLSAADIADSGVLDQMREDNPAAAAAIDQAEAAMRSGQVQLFAFDPGPRTVDSGFATNVNVIHVGDTGGEAIADLADQIAAGVQLQIPIEGEIQSDTTTLPAGEAAVLTYRWTLNAPGGQTFDVAVTQYLIVTDGDAYIVTFSGLQEAADDDRAGWEAMAASFRFG